MVREFTLPLYLSILELQPEWSEIEEGRVAAHAVKATVALRSHIVVYTHPSDEEKRARIRSLGC